MTGANVARAMQLSAPTVHEMIGRLERDGYVTRGADKALAFTDNGREHAEGIVRRHRLIERFLTDVLSIPWDEVHEEAERLEHAMSPVLEARMLAAIGDAKTCPHGHPIHVGRADRRRAARRRRGGRERAHPALRERGRGPAALPQGRRHRARAGGHADRADDDHVVVDVRRPAVRASAAPWPRRSPSSPTRRRRRARRCPSSSCSPRTATGADAGDPPGAGSNARVLARARRGRAAGRARPRRRRGGCRAARRRAARCPGRGSRGSRRRARSARG